MRLSLLGRGAGRPARCPGFFSCFVPTPRTPLFEGTTLSEKVAANLICTTMEPRLGGEGNTHPNGVHGIARTRSTVCGIRGRRRLFRPPRHCDSQQLQLVPVPGSRGGGMCPLCAGTCAATSPPSPPTPRVPGPGPLRRRGVWEAKLASAAESSSPFRKSRYACFKTERGFQP